MQCYVMVNNACENQHNYIHYISTATANIKSKGDRFHIFELYGILITHIT